MEDACVDEFMMISAEAGVVPDANGCIPKKALEQAPPAIEQPADAAMAFAEDPAIPQGPTNVVPMSAHSGGNTGCLWDLIGSLF